MCFSSIRLMFNAELMWILRNQKFIKRFFKFEKHSLRAFMYAT